MASLDIVSLLQNLSLQENQTAKIGEQFANLEENVAKTGKNDGPAITSACETITNLAKAKNAKLQVL